MRRGAGWGLLALVLLPAACESDLARDWTGRACRTSEPRCLQGFVCNEQGRCVTPGQLTSTGTGGASGSSASEPLPEAGSGGAGAGPGTSGPLAGAGGGESPDASVTPEEPLHAGTDGGRELDAGGDAAAPLDAGPELDACTPALLYEDLDGDGYGNPNVSMVACALSGWVGVAGDCRDDLVDVNPGSGFSGVGYAEPGQPGGVSFDYDCSSAEQPDPSNTPGGAAPSCSSIGDLLACSSSGYVATARSGSNISSLCGSTTVVTCAVQTLLCGSTVQTDRPPFRCR